MRVAHLAMFALLLLPGCATFLDGRSQSVMIRTAPEGAACTITRQGAEIARVAATPGSFSLHRDFHDLTVVCQKPGWDPTVHVLQAQFTGVTLINAITFPPALLVDAGNGADWRYDDDSVILMNVPAGSVVAGRR
jgi:hypothetical protein